ncbi:MAG: PTS sugar transporter subunit IIA [Anaeromyxobacter sp.]
MADLSVREVARLLGVSEKAVWRWVRAGEIPHHRLREDAFFNRVELLEWAHTRGHPLPPEVTGATSPEGLAEAMARGGIHRDVPGDTREAALAAVAQLPGVPAEVDRALLRELLISRERLGSTGLGDGIAFPHPRDPLVLGARAPTVIVAFLARPLDFGAIDGRPVQTLFAILSPTVQGHLATLSRLAYVLHDGELRRLLGERAPDAALLARVRAAEAALAAVRASRPPLDEEDL